MSLLSFPSITQTPLLFKGISGLLVLQLISISLLSLREQSIHNSVDSQQWAEVYDYIVVGAGSAGCVVASRLSENPNIRVLLIEAGGPQTIISDMPAFNLNLRLEKQFDWGYRSVSQRFSSFAYNENIVDIDRGRVMGGSGTINAMLYSRGNRRDFDKWVNKYGARGWSYDEVLPYFLKSENNTDPYIIANNPGFHSTGGLLTISSAQQPDPVLLVLQKILNQYGVPTVDLNGPTQLGTTIPQTNTRFGRRHSLASAFIEPFLDRKNLDVVLNAFATKIDIDSNKKATAVNFIKNGKLFRVEATKEIIVSCGAIDSPKLLMLSGIGPTKELTKNNIPVIADLPVGFNLEDHFGVFPIPLEVKGEWFNPYPQDVMNSTNLFNYFTNGTGPMTALSFLITYLNSNQNDDFDWPDIYMLLFPRNGERDTWTYVQRYSQMREQWFDYWRPYENRSYINLEVVLYRVRSDGTVRLRSNNPLDKPLIDPNMLSNPVDFEALVDGLRQSLIIVENFFSDVLKPPAPIPVCQMCRGMKSHECKPYLECVVRQLTASYLHLLGTCRMGDVNDPAVVVDEKLRVKKVSGLRVIDASVMPEMINGNINAATIMIAEKGSQHIIDDQIRSSNTGRSYREIPYGENSYIQKSYDRRIYGRRA